MAIIKFGSLQLGDEAITLFSLPQRLHREDASLLWSSKAYVDDTSSNWLWRVMARIWVKRDDQMALENYVHNLAVSMRGQKADVTWVEGEETIRTYPDCRLDSIEWAPAEEASMANFTDSLIFNFTTDQAAT